MNRLEETGGARNKPVGGLLLLRSAAGLLAVLAYLVLSTVSAHAQNPDDDSPGLKLPEDLAAGTNSGQDGPLKNPDGSLARYQIQETRSAGRLERVTVTRPNGIDEVYENKNIDSMFSRAENEIGEVENVRRWTIGSW